MHTDTILSELTMLIWGEGREGGKNAICVTLGERMEVIQGFGSCLVIFVSEDTAHPLGVKVHGRLSGLLCWWDVLWPSGFFSKTELGHVSVNWNSQTCSFKTLELSFQGLFWGEGGGGKGIAALIHLYFCSSTGMSCALEDRDRHEPHFPLQTYPIDLSLKLTWLNKRRETAPGLQSTVLWSPSDL